MGKLNLGKVRGSEIYTGTKIKGNSGGIPNPTGFAVDLNFNVYKGDIYINTDGMDDVNRGNVYKCITGGDANTARWIYNGNIKGPKVKVINDLESMSATTDALSASMGYKLAQDLRSTGMYATEFLFQSTEVTKEINIVIEKKETIVTCTIDGMEYTHRVIPEEQFGTLSGVIGNLKNIFGAEGVVSSVKTSGARLISVNLYGENRSLIEEKTENIRADIAALSQSFNIVGDVMEENESTPIGTANIFINYVKKMLYPITHAKAVWFSKTENRTVEDEIKDLKKSARNNQWKEVQSLEPGKDILIEEDGMVKIDGSITSKEFSAVRLTVNGIDVFYQQANQNGAVPTRYVHSFMVYKGDVVNGNATDFAYDDTGEEIPKLLFYPQA